MFRAFAAFAFGLSAAALLAGCGDKKTTPTEVKGKKDEHDHSDHKRDEKDVILGGKERHAILSAHFDAAGTALEIAFETTDKEPKPVTLPEKTKITASVKEGEMRHELEFKPGPKDERKTDPDGQCSRFEAATPWMRPNDKLDVTITIEGVEKKVVWVEWVPNKHAHKDHDEK